ncbi:hypothetical protein [uncultured Phycicoccus sp.]|uniref:hypothetical protein n=1 Tax=uncultured Phycicoccus sp. TaxID=661422 RepID=UPI002619C41A|nr:hypothetical protein [uncultured Phycicoccus sp.]
MASMRTEQRTGIVLVLLGLLTSVLSTVPSGGFVRGLFQGATIALMVAAAYLLESAWRGARGREEKLWLPTRDENRG